MCQYESTVPREPSAHSRSPSSSWSFSSEPLASISRPASDSPAANQGEYIEWTPKISTAAGRRKRLPRRAETTTGMIPTARRTCSLSKKRYPAREAGKSQKSRVPSTFFLKLFHPIAAIIRQCRKGR